ncbi:hypothetical protein [Streptomyces sp. NRRL F-5123]|uniref:hypothetical protein n=1 Tax=Streptomyces sp. NRRL F-5123 TaxID=1463856 RepID=UPI0004E247B9|nr:hypothetical protein [Streptomyces sp. NRRL F-5123]
MGLFSDNSQQAPAGGLFGGLPAQAATSVVVQALPGTTLASIPAPYEPHGDGELSDQEQQDLAACKAGVDNLRNAFWIAGKSLETLRTAELHRGENPNFAEWVWDTWEISETQLYRLMDEWRVGEALANLGHKPLEGQVRKLTEVRRQTNDKIAITVYDTIARCTERVTGKLVETVVDALGPLSPDVKAADIGRRVRAILDATAPQEADSENGDVPDISSIGKDSPIGESSPEPSNTKADALTSRDIERLQATLSSLQAAAKTVNKATARRAVEAQPDVAIPLIKNIGAVLQQIDRAVAMRLPKPE